MCNKKPKKKVKPGFVHEEMNEKISDGSFSGTKKRKK